MIYRDFDKFSFREEGPQVEVGQVDGGKSCMLRNDFIEEAFERCEGCCSGRYISLSDAISPCSAPHSSYDRLGDAIPLFLYYSIVVSRRFSGSHHRL